VSSPNGDCALPANGGISKCIAGVVTCCDTDSNNTAATNPTLQSTGLENGECKGSKAPFVLHPNDKPEVCDGADNDCDGTIDDAPIDVGQACGSNVGTCSKGITDCVSGAPVCNGATKPQTSDPCNGADDDCDGVADGTIPTTGAAVACTTDAACPIGTLCLMRSGPSDKVCATPPAGVLDASGQPIPCGAPPAPPTGATTPCKPGKWACNGTLVCVGAVGKTSSTDQCNQDLNCDGRLDNQPNLQTDVSNCGTCGNDCNALGAHAKWSCVGGKCVVGTGTNKCRTGFIDCDTNPNDCEVACTPSGAEKCNGFDDDCNCKIDDGITPPTPVQVCGVSTTASDPGCTAGNGTTGVKVACTSGQWQCTFPSGYCDKGTPASCSTTPDGCDGKDNNCNGATDENQSYPVLKTGYLNQPCFSDDGKPPPGDGVCQGKGVYVCNGTNATKCTAVKDTSKAGTETCDGVDNDCDGLVDETFNNKGTGTSFVKPAVVKINASPAVWMYQYEASRPSANTVTAGTGNGYYTSAPTGVTLDKTAACSIDNRIPWFNVTPAEVEQTCTAMGGFICSTANWTTACKTGSGCSYGYGNCGAAADYTNGPFCNLGPFDYDGVAGAPNTDNVLVTKSSRLNQCWASYGATPASTGLFDITGNLREITKRGTEDYPLMGGAFNTDTESGAKCDFSFYSVASTFKLYDTGFRCCFSADPTQ
jgi:hypothetical protein